NWYSRPVYNAFATVVIKQPKTSTSVNDILTQLDQFTTDKNVQNQMSILTSRSLISRALKELDFDVSYFLKGNIKVTELYKACPIEVEADSLRYQAYSTPVRIDVLGSTKFEFSFYSNRQDIDIRETHRFGERFKTEFGYLTVNKRDLFNNHSFDNPNFDKRNFIISFNSSPALLERYSRLVEVSLVNKNGSILELSLEDNLPEKAIDFLNKLVEVWLKGNIEEKNEEARNSLAFIDEQLSVISRDLSQAEGNYEKFRTEKGVTDLSAEASTYLASSKSYDEQIGQINFKLGFLNSMEVYVRQGRDLKNLSLASMGIEDELLLKLISQLNDLYLMRDRLSLGATSDNPLVIENSNAIE